MKKLAIYGAGGFGREMALMIGQINASSPQWDLLGFFDDGRAKGDYVDGFQILGNINALNEWMEELSVCIAIADPVTRFDLVKKISNSRIQFPVLVHPMALAGDLQRNIFKRGTVITAGVIITTGVTLGEFCILNLSCTIGHDVSFGSCCTAMPGSSVSGNIHVGDCTLVGTGSRMIQGITIGERCFIGAGAVVTKNFGDNLKIMGVPARGFRS